MMEGEHGTWIQTVNSENIVLLLDFWTCSMAMCVSNKSITLRKLDLFSSSDEKT